jgi:HEAT repeat protein
VTSLQLILAAAAAMFAMAVLGVLAWLVYTAWLGRLERRLEARKGVYREMVSGLAVRERALLEPELHQARTLRDFEALEAVLEEQARGVTERPAWLLDTYDRLGLVDKYVGKLRDAKKWRERAFAAELLGRVGNAKAVPILLETVESTRTEDADVREIALRALARIADPRAVAPLVEALRHAEVWLAPRIADILVRHGQLSVDAMIGFLGEPSQHPARAWAANILGEVKAVRAFPVLVRVLSDLDDEVRAKAAGALGRLGDRRAITYLLEHLLSDPAPFVRARIAGALGQFSDTDVIDYLVRALGDPAWWVRMRSVEALEQIGPRAEAPLLLALGDPDPEIRIRAAVALERLGVPSRVISRIADGTARQEERDMLARFGAAGAREFLAEQLHHESARVRLAVVEAISAAGRHDLPAELIEAAREDPDGAVRARCLEVLRAFGVKDAVTVALERLGDAEQSVRTAATLLLGDLGDAALAQTIRPRVTDPEPSVRAAAARALGYIHATDVEAEVIRLLRDPEPAVRVAAAEGAAEGRWSGTVSTLEALLSDSDGAVRVAAARALGRAASPAVIPALVHTFRDATPDLRQAITEAVAEIRLEELPTLLDMMLERNDLESRLAAVGTVAEAPRAPALSLLERLWRDPAPEVRAATAAVLAERGGARAGELLEGGLADPDEVVRARALDGLCRLGRAEAGAAALLLLKQDPSVLVRERAALAVGVFQPRDGEVELLRTCRPDEALEVRAAAVLALSGYDQESMVAQVIAMTDEATLRNHLGMRIHEDPVYQRIAERLRGARHVELRALGAATRQEMEQVLAEGMRGVLEPNARIRLLAGLRAFQGDRSRTALLQVLRSDPTPEVRAAALSAVGGMLDTDELLLVVQRVLGDPHLAVRRAAVPLLSRLSPDKALPILIRALRAEEDAATLQAVAAQAEANFPVFLDLVLGLALQGEEAVLITRVAQYIHHPDLHRILLLLARDRTPMVRAAVATLWSKRPDLLDEQGLADMSADPAVAVREAAVSAWAAAGRFDRAEAMVEDPDPGVRRALALALVRAPAAPALAMLGGDPDEEVRAAAHVARLLRGETAEREPAGGAPVQALARAVRDSSDEHQLRRLAREEPDPTRRLPALLALALVDEVVARDAAQHDPTRSVRDAVIRFLAGPKRGGTT